MKNRITLIIILALLIIPGFLFRFSSDAVTASVAVRPEVLLTVGGFEISNTLFTTWIVMLLLFLFAFFATRQMALIPSGLQNLMEIIIEMLDGLCESVAGQRGRKFFPFVATIFLFVLVSNWLGLIPGFGPIGIIPVKEGGHAPGGISTFELPFGLDKVLGPQEAAAAGEHGAAPSAEHAEEMVLAPFVRSPSTDMNTTLALALISVFFTQVFGMQVVGVFKYWTKFFNFAKIGQFFGLLFKGKFQIGVLLFGLLDLFVGLLEFVSEMVKVLSFTFRLFGNIFAGEVVLLIMAFLFAGLPFPFYGLELFVGFMQAFVFGILTLVFMTIATTAHGAEEHH
ncbi:F-type H+-transporting ATPase subunit a [Anaerolineae bacterium]|nr:F-type H+-transporting ATPase subunit a [Anaerolineae bacterium]